MPIMRWKVATMTEREALLIVLPALKNAYWPSDSNLMPAHNIKELANAIAATLRALEQSEQEPMTRYCPECSHIGDVPTTSLDCCPDGNHARIVPQHFADLCRETFKRSIDKSSLTTAYEQGVGKGHQAFLRKRKIDNPYVEGDCFDAWQMGYREGTKQAKDIEAKT